MKNAHLRIGRLIYEFKGEKRRTSFSVVLDRLVADRYKTGGTSHRAHLLSVLGNDAEIGAINAAIAKGGIFSVRARGMEPMLVYLDLHAQCYRGSMIVPGRNRPLRHLIAISQQWLTSVTLANPEEIFLLDSSPEFLWTNLAYVYGLPARPEWASWFHQQLENAGAIESLIGIGCDPVLVKGDRDTFLSWLGRGVSAKDLEFPLANGPIVWPKLSLRDILIPTIEAGPEPAPQPE